MRPDRRATSGGELGAELAARRIALDGCPTSNGCLGGYPSLAAQPRRRLYQAGGAVTVSSGDPARFGTTLSHEVTRLVEPFDLDVLAIDEILLNAVRHSFLPAAARQQLEASYRAELAALQTVHLQA